MKYKTKTERISSKTSYIKGTFNRYIKNSTPKELSFDWLYPFLISILLFLIISISEGNLNHLISIIGEINNVTVTIIAILAGFNTASLAIIASTNRSIFFNSLSSQNTETEPIKRFQQDPKESHNPQKQNWYRKLVNHIKNNSTDNLLETTLTFFSYAVISQLTILIIGISSTLVLKVADIFSPILNYVSTGLIFGLLLSLGIVWLTLVLHVIFISIRNVDMIYHFIMYKDKK